MRKVNLQKSREIENRFFSFSQKSNEGKSSENKGLFNVLKVEI